MSKTSNGSQTILIVGDWVVDEYWFLVRHQSEISSHTGFSHYRLFSKPSDIVSDLCSAGHVARVMYQLRKEGRTPYNLVGLGNWNKEDTEIIKHLVHAREKKNCMAASASFRLKPNCCSQSPDIQLITLRPDSPTNRVIRQYHQEEGEYKEEGGFIQINRVDWEPQPARPGKGDASQWSSLPKKGQVKNIVVHDLVKGVVTAELITSLKDYYPDARWYVRSKQINPTWLSLIQSSLALLVIGPEVAALLNPWETWLSYGKITIQSLEVIRKMPGENVVLLSDHREVIAKVNSSKHCITGKSVITPTPLTQLGWPSAFFAALVRRMLDKKSEIKQADIIKAMDWADKLGGVPVPESSEYVPLEKRQPNIRASLWEREAEDWRQARKECGIIQGDKGDLRLEVWRGSTYLPGYIACIKEKQEIISRIGQNLRGFSLGGSQARSLSIMLQADPGSGKTFLAKSLAKAFNFSFIRYDVTQMIHRDELLDLFDTLATMQANETSKILVFVDEINALLDGAHAYGAFLAPLEEGVYVRRGKIFSLRPCAWIFAGTRLDADKLQKGEKLSDFKSRMTVIENVDFQSLKSTCNDKERLQDEAKLEQVYLGATMIKNYFSDVQEVSREILEQFHKLDPEEAPARKIRKLAASLRNVQYGKVTRSNCSGWDGFRWDGIKEGEKPVKLMFV